MRVTFDGIGVIDIPRSFFDEHQGTGGRDEVGIDHAYAVTSYAVQGATFGVSTSRVDEHGTRSETYVDITRGRTANHLYLTRAADPLDGEALPKVPPPPLTETITARLEGSGPERAAIDIDPVAYLAQQHRIGRGLASLRAERMSHEVDGHDGTVAARAEKLRARQVARTARYAPAPDLLARMPPRPALPFLAQQWDDAVKAVAVFRAKWEPRAGTGPWDWALGRPTDHPAQLSERGVVIEQLMDVTLRCAAEALRPYGWDPLPDWSRQHLATRASHGVRFLDTPDLHDLYARIETYRERAGIEDGKQVEATFTDALLGPVPIDPQLATRRALLVREIVPPGEEISNIPAGIA